MTAELTWYLARSAGLMAWALAGVGAVVHLLVGSPLVRRISGEWLEDLQRFVVSSVAAFFAVHLGSVLLDDTIGVPVLDALVLFRLDGVGADGLAWGIVSCYVLVAALAGRAVADRLPDAAGRVLGYGALVVFALGTVHGLRSGTDFSHPLTLLVAASLTMSVAGLGALRLLIPVLIETGVIIAPDPDAELEPGEELRIEVIEAIPGPRSEDRSAAEQPRWGASSPAGAVRHAVASIEPLPSRLAASESAVVTARVARSTPTGADEDEAVGVRARRRGDRRRASRATSTRGAQAMAMLARGRAVARGQRPVDSVLDGGPAPVEADEPAPHLFGRPAGIPPNSEVGPPT